MEIITTKDGQRFYRQSPSAPWLPSVTTILDATDSKEERHFWEKWRSKPYNMKQMLASRRRGKLLHFFINQYFKKLREGIAVEVGSDFTLFTQQVLMGMVFNFQDWESEGNAPLSIEEILKGLQYLQCALPILKSVQLPIMTEEPVFNDEYEYAGTIDALWLEEGGGAILADFKTAKGMERLLREEWNERYYLQIAAYWGCLPDEYKAAQGQVIFLVPHESAAGKVFHNQRFLVDLEEWWPRWLERLAAYQPSYPEEILQPTPQPPKMAWSGLSGLSF